jgi:hypothetical protein
VAGVRLITSPPSVSRRIDNVGASMSHDFMGLHGLLQGRLCFHISNNRSAVQEGRNEEGARLKKAQLMS